MQALIPKGNRSVTAIQNADDIQDRDVYSAGVLQHGGSSEMTLFSIPKGQAIPSLRGSTILASTQGHHQLYSDLTTNLNKAGELGNAIGDVAIRKLHATIEQAGFDATSGARRAYGATPDDVVEILAKTYFYFNVGQKTMFKSPLFRIPAGGGAYGSVSTTETAVTVGFLTNGIPGPGRALKMPIPVERTDTVEAKLGVAPNTMLAFSSGGVADGQPTLVWVSLAANVRAEVR